MCCFSVGWSLGGSFLRLFARNRGHVMFARVVVDTYSFRLHCPITKSALHGQEQLWHGTDSWFLCHLASWEGGDAEALLEHHAREELATDPPGN